VSNQPVYYWETVTPFINIWSYF